MFMMLSSRSTNGTAQPPRNSVAARAAKHAGGGELADEEEQEPDAGVLGHVAGDELGLGHRHVERRLGELGLRGDEEDQEADELRDDERVADAAPAEDLALGAGRRRCPAG